MRGIFRSLVMGMCLVACCGASSSEAQSRRDERIAVGASLREVLAAWGEPSERVVRGVKQELVWNYKSGAQVVFKHGKVSSFRTGEVGHQPQVKKVTVEQPVKNVAPEADDSKDILRDIVREIPSGPDGPASGGAPPSSDPNLAGLIPNAVPPQRGGQPAIAPGVVVPSIEEEEDQ